MNSNSYKRVCLSVAALAAGLSAQGAWKHFVTPTAGLREGIRDVSGRSNRDVWAVGSRTFGLLRPHTSTLTFRFNGTAWSEVPSPNAIKFPVGQPQLSELWGVTTLARGRAFAVGVAHPFPLLGTQAIAMAWDGAKWSLDLPPARPGGSALYAVDTSSSGDAWAAGWRRSLGYDAGVLAHRSASSWRMIESPRVGKNSNRFFGLHAVSDTDVWAGGDMGQFFWRVQRLDPTLRRQQLEVVFASSTGCWFRRNS